MAEQGRAVSGQSARSYVAEHFESVERQARAAHVGMWVFIASEALFFAGLFALYGAYRIQLPAAFDAGIEHNDLVMGTANTLVLLTSSFTLAAGVRAVELDELSAARRWLAATLTLGTVFLIIKGVEYQQHFNEGVWPGGRGVYFHSAQVPHQAVFFNLYYLTTGLHALHIVVGGLLISWALVGLRPSKEAQWPKHRFQIVGLYWHFVDVVWIFLWPMFYLAKGRGA